MRIIIAFNTFKNHKLFKGQEQLLSVLIIWHNVTITYGCTCILQFHQETSFNISDQSGCGRGAHPDVTSPCCSTHATCSWHSVSPGRPGSTRPGPASCTLTVPASLDVEVKEGDTETRMATHLTYQQRYIFSFVAENQAEEVNLAENIVIS